MDITGGGADAQAGASVAVDVLFIAFFHQGQAAVELTGSGIKIKGETGGFSQLQGHVTGGDINIQIAEGGQLCDDVAAGGGENSLIHGGNIRFNAAGGGIQIQKSNISGRGQGDITGGGSDGNAVSGPDGEGYIAGSG